MLDALSVNVIDNEFNRFLFKLDNGATATTLSYKTLDSLGYNIDYIKKNGVLLTGSDRPSTADGKKIDGTFELTLKNLILGNYLGLNVLILTSLTFEFSNLLGANVQQFFDWNISYEKEICDYMLVKNKKKFLKNTGPTRFLELRGVQSYISQQYKDTNSELSLDELTLKFISEIDIGDKVTVPTYIDDEFAKSCNFKV